jgi:DNA-binding MarR family transcriptional regulator
VETASLTNLAVRLERDGFLERVRSTKDKRTQFLRLTEAAENVLGQADRIMDIEVVDMTHRMTDVELTTLNGYLQRVLKNIE